MKISEILHESLSNVPGAEGTLPPAPGTTPISQGTVRLYHQTSENNLESIIQHGLGISHARGIEGPRAIYASEKGFYGKPGSRPTLEFFVSRDKWDDPFVLQDVPTSQMIAAHLPWHSKARYILEHPKTLESTLAGEFDNLDGDSGLAVAYVKNNY